MSMKVQKITEPVWLGEGPHWDDGEQALYFVSILDCTIHKYVPATGAHTSTKLDGRPGFIVPVEGRSGEFVVGLERRFVVVSWDGADGSPARVLRDLAEVDDHVPTNRINDGKADPRGRLFAGTMGFEEPPGMKEENKRKGSLFRLDGSSVKKIASGISISNGLAWDLREKACYYTDSLERKIRRYDYDVDTGEISNMTYVFDLEEHNIEGVPDGTTIDTDGNLWVCVFAGSCILHIDPRSKRLVRRVSLPVQQVTSCAWGGADRDVLYVTTARVHFTHHQPPPSGACFAITGLGARGDANYSFKL